MESPRRNGLSKMIDRAEKRSSKMPLRGEADGDAADAEAGDQAGDVGAEIVENDDRRDREDRNRHQQPDDVHRAAEARRLFEAAGAMLDDAEDDLPRPERDLQRRRHREDDVDRRVHQLGRLRIADDQARGGGGHEPDAGPREHPADDRSPMGLLGIAAADPDAEPFRAVEQEEDESAGDEGEQELQAVRRQPGREVVPDPGGFVAQGAVAVHLMLPCACGSTCGRGRRSGPARRSTAISSSAGNSRKSVGAAPPSPPRRARGGHRNCG